MVLIYLHFLIVAGNIDDTQLLFNTSILAVPEVFGYSVDEGLEKFPNFYYPPCIDRFISTPKERLFINYNKNTIEIECPANSTPYIVLPADQEIQLPDPKKIKLHTQKFKYEGPIEVDNWVDYALGTCNEQNYFGVNEWFLKPRFKGETYFARMKGGGKKSKMKEKPMIILFISADSFSRRHFYRKLKKTVDYLTKLNEYLVVDYKLHNIIGSDTAGNQVHVFGNMDHNSKESEQDALGDSAIWKIMKKLNFITLWSTDGCSSNVPRVLGNNPEVDHVVATFFCANKLYSKYTADKYHKFEQRCLGSKMCHSYIMNYTQQFVNQYNGANMWIYNHFTAAHENSGQHGQTLDQDLESYLKWFIQSYSSTSELVIFINGDHGMRYGEHMTRLKSVQEYRLPASFIIAKKSFLYEINAVENLIHNSWRLNSKPDLRESMIFLAQWQNGIVIQKDSDKALSLFNEKISDNRTCFDAGIPPWYCCYIIPKEGFVTNHLNNPLIESLVESVVFLANSELLAKFGSRTMLWQNCLVLNVFSAEVNEGLNGYVLKIYFECKKVKAQTINLWVYLSKQKVHNEEVTRSSFLASFPILLGFEKYYCKVVHLAWEDII